MGTRGSIGFITKANEIKFTYNHFDSYEDGLGAEIAQFLYELTEKKAWKQFEENVEKVKPVKEEKKPSAELQEKYKSFANLDVAARSTADWYCLLRNVQGVNGWEKILSGELEHIIDNRYFIMGSLFCEHGYVLNFRDETLDYYRGFQKEPQKDNPWGEKAEDGYYPCALCCRFSFVTLKKRALEEDLPVFVSWIVETMQQSEPAENWNKVKPL